MHSQLCALKEDVIEDFFSCKKKKVQADGLCISIFDSQNNNGPYDGWKWKGSELSFSIETLSMCKWLDAAIDLLTWENGGHLTLKSKWVVKLCGHDVLILLKTFSLGPFL